MFSDDYPAKIALCLFGLAFSTSGVSGQSVQSEVVATDRDALVFSGVHGTVSQPSLITVWNRDLNESKSLILHIAGEDATAFTSDISEVTLKPREAKTVSLRFAPAKNQLGPLHAICKIFNDDRTCAEVRLDGLSAVGVEGKREPPMSAILETVGYQVKTGWSGMHTHTRVERVGEEIIGGRLRKANHGFVTITAIARYSPDFLLPYGYYLLGENSDSRDGLQLFTVGTLALKTPTREEHNCLYPKQISGSMSFDPGDRSFGIFTASPSHIAYTEDRFNEADKRHISHAARIYPLRDRNGERIENSLLVCFEEASNGDYQDYVFRIDNVVPDVKHSRLNSSVGFQ